MKYSLSNTEQMIMERLWEIKKWTTGAEFWEYFNSKGKSSKRQTVNTYLARMTEKGLLVKNGTAYMYAFTREEYEQRRAKDILDSMYHGSLKKFVAALNGAKRLNQQEKEELKAYLDEQSYGEKEK